MKPAVSIIVPVYNVAGHIGACIASLRAQSHSDFEAVVVDDGSTDGSSTQITDAIDGDPRFHVITQDNVGLSAARNAGLDRAQGDIIGFLDGDDRYDPVFLERMLTALMQHDADWVACGLRNMYSNGYSDTHSTLHDTPEITGDRPRFLSLDNWEQVIACYPSAWNKLYRRSLIDGLCFDEGTWFEDHAFYIQVASRSDRMLYVPEPLYMQTRGRDGQITASDDDRIFDQIAVLDRLAELLADPVKPGGDMALPRLAHRLFHERSTALRTPDRRTRFLQAVRNWLNTRGLPAQPDDRLPREWVLELTASGPLPLSVIVTWDGQEKPLSLTLDGLAMQGQHDFETLIVTDDRDTSHHGVALAQQTGLQTTSLMASSPDCWQSAAYNTGLKAAQGTLVVFLNAGDRLMPGVLPFWCEQMLRENADFGVSQFREGLLIGSVYSGVGDTGLLGTNPPQTGPLTATPDLALMLQCNLSAQIFRRAFLNDHSLHFGRGPRPDWQFGIEMAMRAHQVVYLASCGVESSDIPFSRRFWTASSAPSALLRSIYETASNWPDVIRDQLPPDWDRRLLARAIWERWHFAPMSRPARLWFLAQAAWVIRRHGLHRKSGSLDTYFGPGLRKLMGE
ncbi:MAG: glycosyltransferase family 2 protein [Pseudomonadota bacterium]